MGPPLRVMIVAGEASGDLLGAQLMKALADLTDNTISYFGVGGAAMESQGIQSHFLISEIALMGAAEIAPKLRGIFRRINETAALAIAEKPDRVILIDSPEFNLRVAKRINKADPNIPITIYVAPQVWASRPGRARKMSAYVDQVLALFPFEPEFFERFGIQCPHVGHPVVERASLIGRAAEFRRVHGILEDEVLISVLPGSRFSEVKRLLPIFGETIARLKNETSGIRVVVPTVPHVAEFVEAGIAEWSAKPIVTIGDDEKFQAFDASDAALAASGTVALELALAGTPMVIGYRVDPLTAFVARQIVTVEYANLINLIVDRRVVPEFIQQECTPENLENALLKIIDQTPERRRQIEAIEEATRALGLGDEPPSVRAARAILSRHGI